MGGSQRLHQGKSTVVRGQDFDPPGSRVADLANGADELDDVLVALPDQSAAVPRVLEQGPHHLRVRIAQLDAETNVGSRESISSGTEVPARKTCQKSTSNPAAGCPTARISSAPWGIDATSPKGSGSSATLVPAEAASSASRRSGRTKGVRSSTGSPNSVPILMKRCLQLQRRLQEQTPAFTPRSVILTPPAGGQLDLDVPQTGVFDRAAKCCEPDRVRHHLQIVVDETHAHPPGRRDGLDPLKHGNRTRLRRVEGFDIAGTGPAGGYELRRRPCCPWVVRIAPSDQAFVIAHRTRCTAGEFKSSTSPPLGRWIASRRSLGQAESEAALPQGLENGEQGGIARLPMPEQVQFNRRRRQTREG